MKMIKRDAEKYIRAVAREFAVVSVFGPRQSGKTTLVRSMFPDYDYVNFENPDERAAALADGASFLARHVRPLILDEVQRVPELLSRIQVLVDESPKRRTVGTDPSKLHTVCALNDFEFLRGQRSGAGGAPFGVVG